MALFNVFQAENHLYIEIKGMGTRTECVAMGKKYFIVIGQARRLVFAWVGSFSL